MQVRGMKEEDFTNYKKPSLFLISTHCNWKCCGEAGIPYTVCQNSSVAKMPPRYYSDESIYNSYTKNNITQAVVIGGLEPMEQFDEVIALIDTFRRNGCNDPFVIYTGFYEDEIANKIERLKRYPNIIVKFGRYIPNTSSRYDEVLGVTLVSDNQYAKQIS